jgi:hypothetical protein
MIAPQEHNEVHGRRTIREGEQHGTARNAAKRELIEPHKNDKRYMRRTKAGKFAIPWTT